MKKSLLTAASVLLLGACSSTPGGYETAEYVTGGTSSGTSLASPDVLSADSMVAGYDDNAAASTKELRKDLAAIAGDRVFFDFDSASLSTDAQKQLREMADYIKGHFEKVKSITVEGHCDERGTREYNLALGDRRAVSVKKYLVGLGIDPNMINTISYGKERPADARHNDAAWAKNRRAVVVLD